MVSVKTIKLGGVLGRKFGERHEYAVESWPEFIRAASHTIPGFRDFMKSKVGSTMHYGIFVDGKSISRSDEESWKAESEIRIIPLPAGAKSGGLFSIVVGAAIMVAAFYTGGASLAAMGAFSSAAFMAGGAMVLGGIAQLIAPQSPGMKMQATSTENKPSYAFGAAVNTNAAGYPVCLPYGYRTNGGAIYSFAAVPSDKV